MDKNVKLTIMKNRYNVLKGKKANEKAPGVLRKLERQIRNLECGNA